MAKKKTLIEQYEKYAKRGKTEKFYNFLMEENLIQEFTTEVFNNTYGGYIPEEQRKKVGELINFNLSVLREAWVQKYGEKLANRFQAIITNLHSPSEQAFFIHSFSRWSMEFSTEEQKQAAEQILDIASKSGNIIGVHGSGAELGESILKHGIKLTGDLNEVYSRTNVKEILSRNIALFRSNQPLDVFRQVIDYSGWNKKQGTVCSDMIIVSIPEKELLENSPEIIGSGEESSKYLKPEYINGYARVQRTPLPLELTGFTNNPAFIEKSIQQEETVYPSAIQRSIEGKDLYTRSTQSRLSKVKEKISRILRSATETILGKESEDIEK